MWAKFVVFAKTVLFRGICWAVLIVGTVLATVTVAIGLALLVPVLVTYSLWVWFVERRRKSIDDEFAELVKSYHG